MTIEPSIRLFGDSFYISPYVFSVYVALREKDLVFEYVPVALHKAQQKDGEFRTTSVTGRVPSLQNGDFTVAESSAIVEYLDDAFAHTSRMMPTDTQHRARARQLMSWIRSDLMPIREERATTTMFYERATTPLSAAGVSAMSKLLAVADDVITSPSRYLFSEFSVCDADLAFMLQRLILNSEEVPTKVRDWAEYVWTRPSVREFVTKPRATYVPYQY